MHLPDDARPTERFGDRVANYVRFRPSYPPALLDLLTDACGLTADAVVADVGAGTGLLTRDLLTRAAHVYAVEPNGPMRQAAADALGHHPGFEAVDAPAESLPFDDASIDLITAAQAFHWFDHAAVKVEFSRVLRDGGHVALIWNDRDVDASPLVRGYEDVLLEFVPEYQDISYRNMYDGAVEDFFAPGGHEAHALRNVQVFDREGLLGRYQSSSYAPKEGDPRLEPSLARLEALFETEQVGGEVEFVYVTRVFVGRV